MNKAFAAIAMLVLLCGCNAEGGNTPVEKKATTNPHITVDKLFTNDACTVYRFDDNGSYHYFANCAGSISSRIFCGKGCYYDDTTVTSIVQKGN